MRIRLWSAVALATALALSPGTAAADPGNDKSVADRKVAEAEATLEDATQAAREAGKKLAAVEHRLPGAKDRLNAARGAVAAAQVVADSAADDADAARARHHRAIGHLDSEQHAVHKARQQLGDMVSELYEGKGLAAFNSALGSHDVFQAVDRMSYVNMLARRQAEALDAVTRARQNAKVASNRAAAAKDEAEAAETAAADALDAAQAKADKAETAKATVDGLVDRKSDALSVAQRERRKSLKQYRQAEAESKRIAARLRAHGSGDGHARAPASSSHSGGGGGGSSGLIMPVNGWKSSEFGYRYDPYYHVWQLHAGTDFAAPEGTPIHAAAAGTVVQAGWNGGYGNYTCIYHHDNLSTCYGHQSAIYVSVGQHVSQDQTIGAVGTTGASTGDHLHFEVRINGVPKQPLGWLPSCLCR
ncbi:MAG TPA: M23 family metallopeptidase [Stackebrandtia sp.]|jgi:murein DD-endopeptidase MepM/ murein hydrolase activator NlpD|uniref:M23 family metallopeptidase n=1 Tax=Stackebrandtia sp. TaxID=2023065 RepID=UPI002D5789A1|nr:M23 family metallopeptidase [Stackebrandtia sp.]HZE41302.1 M23 family metallopeptidase [Stackebrandtia sp.]